MGRGGGGGMWASDPIKCNIIIKKGRERTCEKIAKTKKEKCKFGWQLTQARYGHSEHRQDLNRTLRSVHFGVVIVEVINCNCGGIVRNEIW